MTCLFQGAVLWASLSRPGLKSLSRSFLSFHGQSTGSQSIFSLPKLFPGTNRTGNRRKPGSGSEGTTPLPCPAQEAVLGAQPARRSPARGPRAGGARSAAAVTASSNLGAAPDPGGASRPAAPAPGGELLGGVKLESAGLPGTILVAHPHPQQSELSGHSLAPWSTLVTQAWPSSLQLAPSPTLGAH